MSPGSILGSKTVQCIAQIQTRPQTLWIGQPKFISGLKRCTLRSSSTLASQTVNWKAQIQIQSQTFYAEPRFNLGLKNSTLSSSNSNPASKAVDWTAEVHLWPQEPRDINFNFKKPYSNKHNYKASLHICNPYVSALLDATQLIGSQPPTFLDSLSVLSARVQQPSTRKPWRQVRQAVLKRRWFPIEAA
jgi:hypothetical protein